MKTNEMMRAANERLLKANEAIIAANARLQKAREAKEKEEGSENEAEKVEEKPAVVAPASKPIKIVYHNDNHFLIILHNFITHISSYLILIDISHQQDCHYGRIQQCFNLFVSLTHATLILPASAADSTIFLL